MGGIVCCSLSSERKDDMNESAPMGILSSFHNGAQGRSQSPGKRKLDHDSFWEITEELITPFEQEINFVLYFQLTPLDEDRTPKSI